MRVRRKIALIALLLPSAIVFAQTGIDPQLMAKANTGDAAAQVAVGDQYAGGTGVAQDLKQAAAWFRKAADQSNATGEIRLADLYRDGRGVIRDMAQAAALYRKAADQGDAGAQGSLAILYSVGQGVPRSDVEAYYWYDLAAAVSGPNQARYAANRQNVGTRITADELAAIQERVAQWKTAHPRPDPAK